MLREGRLIVVPGQRRIIVHCNPARIGHCTRAFNSPMDEGRSLSARTRFTIAHEIAHTFFLRGAHGTYRRTVVPSTPADNKKLEELCNRTAAELLVPEFILAAELSVLRSLNPWNVWRLAKRFNVSVEMFVHRLAESSFPLPGVIALIDAQQRQRRIRAVAGLHACRRLFAMKCGRIIAPCLNPVLDSIVPDGPVRDYVPAPGSQGSKYGARECLVQGLALHKTQPTVLMTIGVRQITQYFLPFEAT